MENSKVKKTEINKKLADIQQKLKAPKSQLNEFGGFHYRSCEDILEAVKPLLGDLTLITRDEIVQMGERYYVKATATLSDGEDQIDVSALARESETKTGMDTSQITGSSSSYARKYALSGLLALDDTADADTKNNTSKPIAITVKDTTKRVISHNEKTPILIDTGNVDDVLRDTKGHTYCEECGAVVSDRVEKFSKEKFSKVLCMNCQAKK